MSALAIRSFSMESSGVLMAIGAAVAFASKSVIAKEAMERGVEPLTLLSLRMALALPFFMVVGWRGATLGWSDRLWLLGLGSMGYYLSSWLDFEGLKLISSGLERILLFCYPTLVVVFGRIFWKRPVPAGFKGALATSWLGVGLAMFPEVAVGGWLGVGLVLTSATIYALYIIKAGELMQRLGGQRVSAIAASVGGGFLLAQLLATRPATTLFTLPPDIYLLGLLLALGSTVLPVLLFGEAVARIGAARTSALSMVGPVATLTMGWIFRGEPISGVQAGGALLVILGVWRIANR